MLDDFDEVLERARERSGHACAAIYRDLARPVAAFLRGRGAQDVEDLTSEVFLAVFSGLSGFSGSQSQFRAWVFTIAHRRVVDSWRRRGRSVPTEPLEPEHDVAALRSAEDDALARLSHERVTDLLRLVTDEQRDVLLLRVVADLTVEQVAQVLGKRPGAVKALQRRGLATLRQHLVREGAPL